MLTIAGGIILAVIALLIGSVVLAGIGNALQGRSTSTGGGGGFWLFAAVAIAFYFWSNGAR